MTAAEVSSEENTDADLHTTAGKLADLRRRNAAL